MTRPLILVALTCASAMAGSAKERVFSTYADWAQGEAMGVDLWSTGGISRGGTIDSLAVAEEQYVWDLCSTRAGEVLLGTGGGGRVYRYDGRALQLVFDSPESDILCVVEASDGTIWAGSSPDGLVYRIARGGDVEEFRTGQQAVWCLVPFESGAAAGTGPEGRVFALRRGEQAREIARLDMANVLSLLPLPRGDLLAAGDAPGLVQRIHADGTVMTVARLGYEEARSLALLGPDSVGVLAVGGPYGRPGSVLLVGPVAGPLERLWTCPDSLALDMAWAHDGVVVAGGWPGRAYLVRSGDEFWRIGEVGADQVLAVARLGQRLYLGAGTPARLFWIEDRRAKAGSWRSPVIDAETVATWGRVACMGEARNLTIRGRSGNLGDPASGWSAWHKAIPVDGGWDLKMPDARFAQLEVTLRGGDGSSPALAWLRIAYQPHNRAPEITSFSLLPRGEKPPGVVGRPPPGSTASSADSPGDDGDRYLVWNASDPDGDGLAFTVAFSTYPVGEWVELGRRAGESHWLIRQGSLPQGWYRFKVEATDAPDNPPSSSRTAIAIIGPAVIDDTPPTLVGRAWKRAGGRLVLEITVRDEGSGVSAAFASVDAGDWVVMEPVDGVVDSQEERLFASLAEPSLAVAVRLVDRESNGTTVAVGLPR